MKTYTGFFLIVFQSFARTPARLDSFVRGVMWTGGRRLSKSLFSSALLRRAAAASFFPNLALKEKTEVPGAKSTSPNRVKPYSRSTAATSVTLLSVSPV